jgi:cell division inhibitor SulA/protein ImuA
VASPTPIDQLLQDSRIWQAGRIAAATSAIVTTGWSRLDHVLGGGWPLGQLTEFLIDAHGTGEFTLLLPAFRALTGRQDQPLKWVAMVAPPYTPYAPALTRAGLDLARLLVIHSRRDMDTLWAMEQALRSRTCAAVVGWSESVDETSLRRLQLAAEVSESWAVLFRSADLRSSRSPAPLRIHLAWGCAGDRLVLNILKRRGGPPAMAGVDVGR